MKCIIQFIVSIVLLCQSTPAWAEDLEDFQVYDALFTSHTCSSIDKLPPLNDHRLWHEVSLPHNWDNFEYAKGRNGWYHIDYVFQPDDAAQAGIQAIYLPRLNMNVAVYINNKLLNIGGDFIEPMARNWNRPLIFVIPEGMLNEGHNTVDIHVKAYLKSGAGLGTVYIGPETVLNRDYKWHHRAFISTTMISCALCVALGAAMLLFWYLRKEKMFFWFSLACFFSAFYLSNHFIQNIPVSRHLWEWAFQVSIDCFVFCLMLFTHRWLKLDRHWLERDLWIYLPLSMIVLFFLPERMMMTGFNINHLVFLMVGVYLAWLLLNAWLEQKNRFIRKSGA